MILFAFFGTCGAISIHAPAKGATLYFTSSRRALRFQSTLPRRERLNGAMNKIDTQIFQSTLPRRERLFLCFYFSMFHIFQSTLPRRERLFFVFISQCFTYFNPRSREGSDDAGTYTPDANVISIHAPAKGATLHMGKKMSYRIFQSTLPRRERLISRRRLCVPILFQSTLPRRERHKQIFHKCQVPYFNPRSREGSDRIFSCHNNIWVDFNPRSREGSDSSLDLPFQFSRISIHAPAKGATFRTCGK